jgi:hypothetical protein
MIKRRVYGQTLLRNARLIDGLTDQPQERMSILINGDRIVQVASGDLPSPAGQTIDLGGKTGSRSDRYPCPRNFDGQRESAFISRSWGHHRTMSARNWRRSRNSNPI